MSELKPCPFCGSEMELRISSYSDWHSSPSYWVCHVDLAHAEEAKCPVLDDSYNKKAEAIEAWNRRATDANNE